MTDPVKPRRYDNSARRSHSDETRQRILGAARQAMVDRGYQATNVADIAAAVGVHIDTVYRLIGPKPVLLRELIERAISGRDAAVVAEERDYVKAIRAEADPARKLAIYAAAMYEIQGRLAPLLLALRDAATTEPEARQVWQEISDRRAANMRRLTVDLATAGGLRPGLSLEHAADIIWVTNSAEVYLLLTRERGWPPERYRQWLEETWCRLLLPEPSLQGPPDSASPGEAQRNVSLFRRLIDEGFVAGTTDVLPEILSADFVEHQRHAFGSGDAHGIEALAETIRALHAAIDDFSLTIEDVVADRDRVWARLQTHGTTRPAPGMPAQPVSTEVIDICRFRDGRIVEHWGAINRPPAAGRWPTA